MRWLIKDRLLIYKTLKSNYKGYRKNFIQRTIFVFILTLTGIVSPYFYKILIDYVLIGRNPSMLLIVCFGTLSVVLIRRTIGFCLLKIDNHISNGISFTLKKKIWRIFMNTKPDFLEKFSSGELKNRIDSDVDVVTQFFSKHIIDYFMHILNLLILLGILFYINWILAILSILMIPVSFWITKILSKKVNKYSEIYREEYGRYEHWMVTTIKGWKEIKALNAMGEVSKKFSCFWNDLIKASFSNQLFHGLNEVLNAFNYKFLTQMNLYFVGGLLIFSGWITVGSLLVFMAYYKKCFNLISAINNANIKIAAEKPAINNIIEMLTFERQSNKSIRVFKGIIEFKDVCFKYNENQQNILNHVGFKINENECIAIVGNSGHGKTTIVKLMLGLYSPQQGTIYLDGINITEISEIELYANVKAIMQDFKLFNMSIKENLLLVNSSAEHDEIVEVCRKAQIHEFIESLPDKYDTHIGERGMKLSGGQRQRLAIARMMLTSPKIIIMDEATSAIDNITETEIYSEIKKFATNRTLIVIAHRFSSITIADRILVLKNGEAARFGTSQIC